MVTARIELHIAPDFQFLLSQQIVEMSWPGVHMVPAVCHPHLFICRAFALWYHSFVD